MIEELVHPAKTERYFLFYNFKSNRRSSMNNFIFSIPTTAYFGKGQINILGETISPLMRAQRSKTA